MDAADIARRLDVSRETLTILEAYVDLLRHWQARINLVSASSLDAVWQRHILDCGQLMRHIPESAEHVVDMGAGAGLPGLVLAIVGRERPDLRVTLVEANAKKCAFLHFAAAQLKVRVEIRRARLEQLALPPADVVTARALAPLDTLLRYARPFSHGRTRCLFLKGQDASSELTAAAKYWKMAWNVLPSLSDPSGSIIVIEDFQLWPTHTHGSSGGPAPES